MPYNRVESLENKGKVPIEMELSTGIKPNKVAVSSSLRLLEPKRTIESRAKRSSINLVRTQHPSETMVFHNEDGNPARANIKQALGRPHKGVKASANSDVMYFFTSAQDGDPLQDDVRLCLGDDLKKAQDHTSSLNPKGPSPEAISQFRPVSLCKFVYRVISRVMANRLKAFMHCIISPQQSAFILCRLIQDYMIVVNEAFHYIRNKKKGDQKVMALKLDLNNAFDRVQ
ncbi:reverse transcriptase [Tanacetum coccineum]